MPNSTIEINVDSLVGPTHHYSGMGVGNVASMEHRYRPSSPKRAAMEGLNKAWLVAQTGVPQFLLPPLRRPRLDVLARYGFSGTVQDQLDAAFREDNSLISSVYSSSFMWAANAATVTAASDSSDGKMHMTIANLSSSLHRAIEADERYRQLVWFFQHLRDEVMVHPALPGCVPLRDEGAANHMRLSAAGSTAGFNVFVHGDAPDGILPEDNSLNGDLQRMRFMPRHTLAASRMIQRHHRLDSRSTFHLQQHPCAISAGVFHNDVIATSHQNLMIHHEMAFTANWLETVAELQESFRLVTGIELIRVMVRESDLSLQDAVRSYLFNSQLIGPSSVPVTEDGNNRRAEIPDSQLPRMLILSPQQCREIPAAERLINRWIDDPTNPIDQVVYVDLRQSMAGGGGPACLRLRLPVDPAWISKLPNTCRLDDTLYSLLMETIDRYYPEQLTIDSLASQEFAKQSWNAGLEISKVMEAGE